jgi:hypothetical protein
MMTPASLEERVAQLERRMDELSQGNAPGAPQKDWRRTVGMFRGDPIMKEIIDEALRMREAEREAARQQERSEQP